MLVLTRAIKERIMIADGTVVITVVEFRGGKVRIGIDAPAGIDVHREEVYNRIVAEKEFKRERESEQPTTAV